MSLIRTPSYGLKLLEKLYDKHRDNRSVIFSLANAYIRLNKHEAALSLINKIALKVDVQTLKYQAWVCHYNRDKAKEKNIWLEILRKEYFAQAHATIDHLFLRSYQDLVVGKDDIVVICVVYNEILRLPCFLKHYRRLGISQFIFIDNNSEDGTLEFLLRQKDCHVFWSNNSFFEAGFGYIWQHHIIETYLDVQWYILADADELLVYPDCETRDLKTLTAYLAKHNYEAMSGFMLDMFNTKPIEIKEADLLEQSPLFYNNYYNYSQIYSPYLQIGGGIRNKLFNEYTQSFVKTPLACAKYPIKYLSATHVTTPTRTADITSAFLHFKFIGDYESYIKDELKRKQHSGGAIRYRQYLNIYQKISQNICFDKIEVFKDSRQLVDLNLLKTSTNWNTYNIN